MNTANKSVTKAKILIVDDESIVAVSVEHALKRFGYDVVGMAGNADSAIEMVKEKEPDLVLMDIML